MYLLFYNKKQRENKKTSLFSGAISKMKCSHIPCAILLYNRKCLVKRNLLIEPSTRHQKHNQQAHNPCIRTPSGGQTSLLHLTSESMDDHDRGSSLHFLPCHKTCTTRGKNANYHTTTAKPNQKVRNLISVN